MLETGNLWDLPSRRRAQRIGYLAQRSSCALSLSALDVVLMGCKPVLGVLQRPGEAHRRRALELLGESHRWPNALRSVAIRAGELCSAALPEQMDVFTAYAGRDAQRRLDAAIDRLRSRFGRESVLRGAVFADRAMAAPPDQEEYSFVRKLA